MRKVLLENSEALVLTVSKSACQRINELAVQSIFAGNTAYTLVQMDNKESQMLFVQRDAQNNNTKQR